MNSIIPSRSLPLDQNPAAVYIASLGGPRSTGGRTQLQALRAIARTMNMELEQVDWASLRYQHTAAIRAKLAASYAPATANKMLSALRQTLKHAWRLGQIDVDDYMKAADLEPITGHTEPAGRYLSQDEIRRIFAACRADPHAGVRDTAIIALMYIALLRREEVVRLDLSSYDTETGSLRVIGKRNRERTVYVTNGARDALHAWLAVRGSTPGALFPRINKSGRITSYERMSPQAVYNIIEKRSDEAGVANNSPHNFRRTGASEYLNITDTLTVANIGGWSSVQTLKRYDRRPEEQKREAASLLKIPV